MKLALTFLSIILLSACSTKFTTTLYDDSRIVPSVKIDIITLTKEIPEKNKSFLSSSTLETRAQRYVLKVASKVQKKLKNKGVEATVVNIVGTPEERKLKLINQIKSSTNYLLVFTWSNIKLMSNSREDIITSYRVLDPRDKKTVWKSTALSSNAQMSVLANDIVKNLIELKFVKVDEK